MTAARAAILGVLAIAGLAGACSSSTHGDGGGASSSTPATCAIDSDCARGTVCGWSNQVADGGDAGCSARGVCVTPVDRMTTMLCGCGGKPVDLVVDDPDAGIYYWSGVIVGEQGFPPCGDAAIAPSSNPPDASSQ